MNNESVRAVITGTGSCLPEVVVRNDAFLSTVFFEDNGRKLHHDNETVTRKFQEITGISERRYARPDQNASDLAFLAAAGALESAGKDAEELDYIIVAHNFGDVAHGSNRVSIVPSLASRVKAMLEIQNPDCVAYDLPFGCPGWVEGLIQANYFIRSGDAKSCLVIGTETLSRIIDPHDRDSMIFSDGSGAALLEATSDPTKGILAHKTQTYASEHYMLNMGHSYAPDSETKDDLFIKMNGRKVYEFALTHMPLLVKSVLDKAALTLSDIKKVLIHQANEKMDSAILDRLFRLYGNEKADRNIMPMTVGWLGNSSVATIPTLLDLIIRGRFPDHRIGENDAVVFASVGAGMNINAVVYRF